MIRKDPVARRAVVTLLIRGLITVPEAARLAGVSRRLVSYWLGRARARALARRWTRCASLYRKEARDGEARLREVYPNEERASGSINPGRRGRDRQEAIKGTATFIEAHQAQGDGDVAPQPDRHPLILPTIHSVRCPGCKRKRRIPVPPDMERPRFRCSRCGARI